MLIPMDLVRQVLVTVSLSLIRTLADSISFRLSQIDLSMPNQAWLGIEAQVHIMDALISSIRLSVLMRAMILIFTADIQMITTLRGASHEPEKTIHQIIAG